MLLNWVLSRNRDTRKQLTLTMKLLRVKRMQKLTELPFWDKKHKNANSQSSWVKPILKKEKTAVKRAKTKDSKVKIVEERSQTRAISLSRKRQKTKTLAIVKMISQTFTNLDLFRKEHSERLDLTGTTTERIKSNLMPKENLSNTPLSSKLHFLRWLKRIKAWLRLIWRNLKNFSRRILQKLRIKWMKIWRQMTSSLKRSCEKRESSKRRGKERRWEFLKRQEETRMGQWWPFWVGLKTDSQTIQQILIRNQTIKRCSKKTHKVTINLVTTKKTSTLFRSRRDQKQVFTKQETS